MTTTLISAMTPEDRRAHMLKLGAASNAKRTAKAAVRRGLKTGELAIADVLANPPVEIHGETVAEILHWARGIGDYKARRIKRGIVFGHELVEHLSPPTRVRLAERIEEYA